MDHFKFACPVCGQHISCEPGQAGSQMKCPTCFQTLIVPQAPEGQAPGFIITASKVSDRLVPKVPRMAPARAAGGKPPYAAIGFFVVLIAAVVCGVVFKDRIFKTAPAQMAGGTNIAASATEPPASTPLPASDGTNWTLNLTNVSIPDLPAFGRIHGADFRCERATLNEGTLNLRQGRDWPPDLGASIHLGAGRAENLAGRLVYIAPNLEKAPEVDLRWKDAFRQPNREKLTNGYALRILFGGINGEKLSGKIYLCTPDGNKSWVVGTFEAQIHQQ